MALLTILIFIVGVAIAQPPPPNGGVNPTSGNTPVGGNAPIREGLGLLVSFSIIYALSKHYQKKQETTS